MNFKTTINRIYIKFYFSGLARTIIGITEDTQRGHIIRATLEAVCYQTRDILEAMNKDCGLPLTKLQVDGGMVANNLLMQLQADLCGIPVGKLCLAFILCLKFGKGLLDVPLCDGKYPICSSCSLWLYC